MRRAETTVQAATVCVVTDGRMPMDGAAARSGGSGARVIGGIGGWYVIVHVVGFLSGQAS